MERRFLSLATARVSLDQRGTDPPTIVGYGAVYFAADDPGTQYQLWDDLYERIMPGAFDRAAREDDCRALFNHDPNFLLGRTSSGTCKLTVDSRGLRYEIKPPDTQSARDVMESIRRGDLTGSSFAFMVTDQTWRETEGATYREIRGVQLFDVGPVTYPAYEATTTGMRAQGGDGDEARAALDQWREAVRRRDRDRAAVRARMVELENFR